MKDIESNPKYNLTKSDVQNLIAKRHSNGLKHAVRQIGNRYFIDEDLFDKWYTSEFSIDKLF